MISRALDVGAGRHNLADVEVAEGDDALDHFLLVFVHRAFGGALGDHGEDFLLDGVFGGVGVIAEGNAGEAANDFVEDVEDADDGPEEEVDEFEEGPDGGEEEFAGVLGPGLRDRDGEDDQRGDGDQDGPGKDLERIGVRIIEEVPGDRDHGGGVGGEADDGCEQGDVVAAGEDGVEGGGAAGADEGLFELDAGEGAEGVGDGGEE